MTAIAGGRSSFTVLEWIRSHTKGCSGGKNLFTIQGVGEMIKREATKFMQKGVAPGKWQLGGTAY